MSIKSSASLVLAACVALLSACAQTPVATAPAPAAWQGFGGESYVRTVEALTSYDDRFADYWAFLAYNTAAGGKRASGKRQISESQDPAGVSAVVYREGQGW